MKRRFRVEYLPLAEQDLLDIVDYIARDRPRAARTFIDRVDRAVARLSTFPRSGRRPHDERLQHLGYRLLVVDGYVIFYVITGNVAQIRRVIHGARRYEFLLGNE